MPAPEDHSTRSGFAGLLVARPIRIHVRGQAQEARLPFKELDTSRRTSEIPSNPFDKLPFRLSVAGHPFGALLGRILDVGPVRCEVIDPRYDGSIFNRFNVTEQLPLALQAPLPLRAVWGSYWPATFQS